MILQSVYFWLNRKHLRDSIKSIYYRLYYTFFLLLHAVSAPVVIPILDVSHSG